MLHLKGKGAWPAAPDCIMHGHELQLWLQLRKAEVCCGHEQPKCSRQPYSNT